MNSIGDDMVLAYFARIDEYGSEIMLYVGGSEDYDRVNQTKEIIVAAYYKCNQSYDLENSPGQVTIYSPNGDSITNTINYLSGDQTYNYLIFSDDFKVPYTLEGDVEVSTIYFNCDLDYLGNYSTDYPYNYTPSQPTPSVITIEENHELLDIILGYRPDKYTPKFTTVTFTNITGVPINFSLISPSGVEYTEIKEYRISEEGIWSWSAWAEGYESTSQTFNINKADYGRYISIEINLVQLVGDVLVTGDCYLDIYSQRVPYMDIAQYKYSNSYQYLKDHNVYNGDYQYYDEYNSYYLNTYEYPGYMTLHYYYKTGNSNLVELDHVPLIKSEYEGDTTGSMDIDLIDELTGNPPRGRIYYKMIGNFGMQNNVESDFADSVDYDGSYNETSNIHINNILAGYYTVMIWGDYYKKSFVNMVSSRDNQHSARVYLTPAYSASALRAILSWGSSPQDLDSHLKIYNSENTQLAHVYYSDKEYHKDNVLMAKLDVDEQEGYGPETTSVYQLESGNMYYFYVYNYSADRRVPTDARVDIKDSDTLVTSVSPPDYISDGSDGYYWKVFKYSADTQIIEIKNEVVGYEPDIYNWDNLDN